MLKIHVLNVKLGDSLILETELDGRTYYSILDCKAMEGRAPTVEFLRARDIRHIQSAFLTHLHSDHASGFPLLLDYLRRVNGTLEYFVSPQIPAESELWKVIISSEFDETNSSRFTKIAKALLGLQNLPSQTHSTGKAMSVRVVYEGQKSEHAWRDHLHPAVLFAPVNPTPDEAFRQLSQHHRAKPLDSKVRNSISHAFLLRHDTPSGRRIALLTGDLTSKEWRFVKNRCMSITNNGVRAQLSFLKVAHHGDFNHIMAQCLEEIIDNKTGFIASIGCPPADPKHPDLILSCVHIDTNDPRKAGQARHR